MSSSLISPNEYKARLEELVDFLQTEEGHDVTVTWNNTERFATFTRFDENSGPRWHLRICKPTLDDYNTEGIRKMLVALDWKQYLDGLEVGSRVLLSKRGPGLALSKET